MHSKRSPMFILVPAFLASTAFFLWQHTTGVGWDFAAYSLNARWWFQGGSYFQALRPPMVPLIIGLFSLLSKALAEYLYIAAASLLFAYSSIRLARKFDLPPALFYLVSLTPFVLIEGFKNGTELFCLALLELLIVHLGTKAAPLCLGLAILTRYPAALFGVLLLFSGDVRIYLRDAAIAAAVCLPWLIYNQIFFGHWAASFMDSYAMNMKFRGYLAGPFRLADVGKVGSYLLPLALIGLMLWWKKRDVFGQSVRNVWPIIVFMGLALFSYARVQQKQTRYLFDLTLPLAVFAAAALGRLNKKAWPAVVAAGLAVLCSGSIVLAWQRNPESVRLDNIHVYERAMKEIGPLVRGCRLASNAWDFINYFSPPAEPFPMDELIETRIEEGCRLLLFKNMAEPKLSRGRIDRLPILAETNAYVLLGKTTACAPARPYVYRYLDLKRESAIRKGRANFPRTLLQLIFYKDKPQ
jgi:hypothetical protein